MGEVWKARDSRLDRLVAIKLSRAQFTERFEREARAIAALNHPNIAQVYDVGENYLVMEFVDGEPVRAPDSIRKLLDIAIQIADGLAASHTAGFIHRDLKPDNIFVTKSGTVKILDFGLAKHIVPADGETTITTTGPGIVAGTIAYMSPEQARGFEADARSDQFSFGLVLYELATGKRAFARETAPEVLTAILREDPEPLPSSLPAPVRWIIERCLAKDPQNRFDTTRGLLLELRTVRDRLSEISSVSVAISPAGTLAHRQSWLLAGAAVLLCVLAAGFGATIADVPAADISQIRFVPFAVTTDNETLPEWSPDGRSIAYTVEEGSTKHLMVKSVGGGVPVSLLRSRSVMYLSWSADGERIYYQDRSDPPGFLGWIAAAGGEPHRLGPDFDDGNAGAPAMSPDGKTLAVLVRTPSKSAGRRVALSSPPGSTPRPFGPELPCCLTPPRLEWASDGSYILVHIPEQDGRRHLWRLGMDAQVREYSLEAQSLNAIVHPLPGGRFGVVSAISAFGSDQGLHLFDFRSGAVRTLIPSATAIGEASVSRDGSRVAYVTQSHGFALKAKQLDDSPLLTSVVPAKVDQHSIAWSPRSNVFAFVRQDSIVLRNADGTTEQVLLTRKDFPSATTTVIPAWLSYSRDGSRILFSCAGCEPGLSLWTVSASGGAPTRIARGDTEGGYAATFSPDGHWIAYNHTRLGQTTVLAKLNIGSGQGAEPIHDKSCYTPVWSPNADLIACNGNQGLELISADGKQVRQLLAGRVDTLTWSSDGHRIYFFRTVDGHSRLEEVDPVSAKTKVIAHMSREYLPAGPIGASRLSLSPDGKSVAWSVLEQDGDIWIVDGFQQPRRWWERVWPRGH